MNPINDIQPASVLSLFDMNKEEVNTFAQNIIYQVVEGYRNPLDVHLQKKCIEAVLKTIDESQDFKRAVLNEVEKYGQRSFEYKAAKIEVKEVGVKYDYSMTEDQTYHNMVLQMEELKTKMKARENFLQTIPEGGIADPETGAMIYRAAKSSSTTPVVTLK